MTKTIIFNKVELTELNQAESKKYVQKLEEIEEYGKQLKKQNADNVLLIQSIQEELGQLNEEKTLSVDIDRIKAIGAEQKALEQKLSEIVLIEEHNIANAVRKRLESADVKELAIAADKEHSKYSAEVDEVLSVMEAEVERLKRSKVEHLRGVGARKKTSF